MQHRWTCVVLSAFHFFTAISFADFSPTSGRFPAEFYRCKYSTYILANPQWAEEWRASVVRDPAKPLILPAYPETVHEGIREVFAPWYFGTAERVPYLKMLQAQHTVFVTNIEGSGFYQGASRRDHGLRIGYRVNPGHLLFDHAGPDLRVSFAFRYDAHLVGEMTPRIEQMRARYFANRPANADEPSEHAVDPMFHTPIFEVRALPDFPDYLVTARFYEHYMGIDYVTMGQAMKVLARMGEIVDRIRFLDASSVRDRSYTMNELFTLLAKYAYYAAFVHPFPGANMSTFMSHVNFALDRWGLRGISHGEIDYRSFGHDFPYYEARFREIVLQANPHLNKESLLALSDPAETLGKDAEKT